MSIRSRQAATGLGRLERADVAVRLICTMALRLAVTLYSLWEFLHGRVPGSAIIALLGG